MMMKHVSLFAALLHAAFANAAVESAFDLTTQVEYEDNPQLLPDDQAESVWRNVTTPRYRISRSEDRWTLAFAGDLRVQRSSNDQLSFDREDPTANLAVNRQSAAGELRMTAGFAQASTRITEFEDSNLLFRDGTREMLSANLEWSGILSAVSSYDLALSVEDVTFEDSPLVDFRNQTSSLSYRRAVSELVAFSVVARATRFDPQTNDTTVASTNIVDQEILYAGIGLNYQLSERWSSQVNAGLVDVTFDNLSQSISGSDINPTFNDTNGNWNFDGSLSFKDETSTWSVAAGRQTDASGLGRATTATSFSGSAGFQVSEKSRLGAKLGWRKNRDVIDNESLTALLSWARTISQNWSWQVSYQYREQNGINEADSNSVVVSLVYRGDSF